MRAHQFCVPAMVLFPTPPFADETAMTFFTSFMLRFCGSPRCMRGICGGAPERGRPCEHACQPLSLVGKFQNTPKDSHAADTATSRTIVISSSHGRWDGCGVRRGNDAHVGETKRRCSSNFFVGRKSSVNPHEVATDLYFSTFRPR